MKARYVNPYTDFGFKRLFGEEANKDLLKDFLNELLPVEHKIVELNFKNTEQWGVIAAERKAIFDIHCENANGERFIIEMQKAKIKFLKDRAMFYTTFPIREQAEKGEWDFELNPIYCVALLDFKYDEDREKKDFIRNVQLKDQYCQVFYNKLTYVFIEMPRFTKEEPELETHFDKWLYFLKHLEDFEKIPEILKEEIFEKAFHVAEIANFTAEQLAQYEESLKVYRDLKGVVDTSYEEGKAEGRVEGKSEGKIEIALKMKLKGEPAEKISEYTDLSIEEINQLKPGE
ncbi:MAG: Rpn family recombination-promoting nuclease/putative transposase [Candidatus Aminicenantes bacterium]|nr:Rpn family recombination-promoting nuclease/putative transposase [Candidatus Aminicenantes bacterium]NIM79038.1 Rpn family recombination-promoting nuclease/putative transposase [Candidatus Aminicenantes bacterium]NIN18317.1 Rpn family recombination-promoting nuclease/putative transposase [Candidatus Aminicenantes bacterium]NIN42204.1 Rpn family recombination-promoting nuclease/putative transposase [Candidatus Aminicenantes bacterium]NIN84970.1 Rpn family recombination-promoting nuclease/puta